MKLRRINVLLILLAACAATVHAQDGAVPDADVPAAATQPSAPEAAAALPAEQSAVATPAPAESASMPPATGIAAPAPADPGTTASTQPDVQPVTPPAPSGAAPVSPADDERLRSVFIVASAVVLVGALGAIIVLLVKRGREESKAKRQYVAEAYLRDINGSTAEPMYKLGSKPIMLGRVGGKDTEFLDYIVVPSATVGRRHALIEFKDFGYWIMDQGSINGTFVNGRPVSSEVRLKHGDRIRLHKLEFEFVMPEVSESSVTVLAQDAARQSQAAAAAPAPEPELVLEPEPDAESAGAGGALDDSLDGAESEEETLLPGSSVPAPQAQGSGEETLLPAGGSTPATGAEETLLPASGAAARGKSPSKSKSENGDEFFDITRGT